MVPLPRARRQIGPCGRMSARTRPGPGGGPRPARRWDRGAGLTRPQAWPRRSLRRPATSTSRPARTETSRVRAAAHAGHPQAPGQRGQATARLGQPHQVRAGRRRPGRARNDCEAASELLLSPDTTNTHLQHAFTSSATAHPSSSPHRRRARANAQLDATSRGGSLVNEGPGPSSAAEPASHATQPAFPDPPPAPRAGHSEPLRRGELAVDLQRLICRDDAVTSGARR